jgi:proline iminopeptidase
VIFYDAAGTGQSRLPANTTLDDEYNYLDVTYYAEKELPALLRALKMDKVHLIGNSYGTSVALQYALATGAKQIVSLTLNAPVPSIPEYYEAGWDTKTGSIGTMPSYFRDRYQQLVSEQKFDSAEFQAMEGVLWSQFLYRSGIMTDCFYDTYLGMNQELYKKMFSVSEWVQASGTMKDFDVLPRLRELAAIPILLTYGEFDVVRPPTVEKMKKALIKSEVVRLAGAAHVTWVDATGDLLRSISDFVNRVETQGNKFTPKTGTNPPPASPSDASSSTSASIQPTTVSPPSRRHHTPLILFFFFLFLIGLYFYMNQMDVRRNQYRYETVV